jgi:hypothetical protein
VHGPPLRTLFAVLALGLAAPSCAEDEDEPVTAARAFARALRSGETKALLPMLEPEVVARLEAAAERASDQVGGRRRIAAHEMLQAVGVDPLLEIALAQTVTREGDEAQVKLVATDGREWVLSMVRVDGSWRVRVPAPAGGDAAPEGDDAG